VEVVLNRPSAFSEWMRKSLKPATAGLITQDLDYAVFFKGGGFLLVEEKASKRAKVSPPQAVIAKMLSEVFSKVSPCFLGYFLVYALKGEPPYAKLEGEEDFENLLKRLRRGERVRYEGWFEEVVERYREALWDCKGRPSHLKTERERSFFRPANLKTFFEERSLEYATVDWILVNYCTGYFVLLQEGELSHRLKELDGLLEEYNAESPVRNPKSGARYKYLGLYRLQFNPPSGRYALNGKAIREEELIRALNLETEEILNYR